MLRAAIRLIPRQEIRPGTLPPKAGRQAKMGCPKGHPATLPLPPSPSSSASASHPGGRRPCPHLAPGSGAARPSPRHHLPQQRRWQSAGAGRSDTQFATMLCRDAAQGRTGMLKNAHLTGCPLDEPGETGRTPATAAAEGGHDKVLMKLHEWGEALDRPDANGDTPADLVSSSMVLQALYLCGAVKLDHCSPIDGLSLDSLLNTPNMEDGSGVGPDVATQMRQDWREEQRREAVERKWRELSEQLGVEGAVMREARRLLGLFGLSFGVEEEEEEEGEEYEFDRGTYPQVSLLHIAAYMGCEQSIIFLCSQGSPLDQIQRDSLLTPLGIAARQGHQGVVGILAERGALLDLPGRDGSTPLQAALALGHRGVTAALRRHGAPPAPPQAYPCPILASAAAGRWDHIRTLAPYASLTVRDGQGRTAAHLAAEGCHMDAMRELARAGAPLHEADHGGHTPISAAVLGGNHQVVAALAEAGVPLGTTPVEGAPGGGPEPSLALAAALLGHEEVVRVLGEHGAPLKERFGPQGITPLGMARERGWHGVERALLEAFRD